MNKNTIFLKKAWKRRVTLLSACFILLAFVVSGVSFLCLQLHKNEKKIEMEKLTNQWTQAQSDPMSAYPETVTYTLGKMTGENNSNMPAGDTYENNTYTRYLKEKLNIQNKDVLEETDDNNYDLMIRRKVIEGNMPDIMVVNDYDYLKKLVDNDMIEDLTSAYEQCTTQRIKDIYSSYGDGLLKSATFDGKLMALPSTEVYPGCSILWLRDDWRTELGLSKPKTIADVENILMQFKSHQFNGVDNVGIVCNASLVGMESSNYSMDPVFAAFHAYPQVWLKDEEGNLEYGSISENTKNALAFLSSWYKKGILDENYMMRTPTKIGELIQNNRCGAFFGWWWAPNNPLMSAKENNPDAIWVPYLITDEEGVVNSYIPYQSTKYVVVRKGFEHPEIVTKITSALFDEARYNEEAKEIEDYATGVDVTARPLVINCDYSQAVFYATEHIEGALNEQKNVNDLNALERAYLSQCQSFQAGNTTNAGAWSAYASRIQAVGIIRDGNVIYHNNDYVQETRQMLSQKLHDMEILAFMKIITGEEPISYFDTFVAEWKAKGGDELPLQNKTNPRNSS